MNLSLVSMKRYFQASERSLFEEKDALHENTGNYWPDAHSESRTCLS